MSEYFLPRTGDDIDLVDIAISRQPSYTHFFDIENDRVRGMTDDIESMKQAVYLLLLIARGKYPIYSWNYAADLYDLIGKPIHYAMSEVKRIITEALLRDDRIIGTSDFSFKKGKEDLLVFFTVKTIFGDFNTETTVQI